MRIDELHKFSDGTLDDVRTALNDRLKGIRMEYLPQTFWSQRDKVNARAMIQAIDKRLKTRRIMRSLERFVGGRPYGGITRDGILLEPTSNKLIGIMEMLETKRGGKSDEVLKSKNFKEVSVTLIPNVFLEVTKWLKLKNFKERCNIKVFQSHQIKIGMSIVGQKSQGHKMAKFHRWRKEIGWLDDLKMLTDHNGKYKFKGTSSIPGKSMITTHAHWRMPRRA
ncbi:hypothetical protein Tco_1194455 [Tanacetum coccineum]